MIERSAAVFLLATPVNVYIQSQQFSNAIISNNVDKGFNIIYLQRLACSLNC